MKNKVFYLVALAVGMVFVMSGCKDDECFDETNPECSNFDPCHDVKPANADFGMYWTGLSLRTKEYFIPLEQDADTIYLGSSIRFQPFHPADKFIWYISNDTSRVNAPLRSFNGFDGIFEADRLYNVTRISEFNPTNCLKKNELIDSITKKIYIIKSPERSDVEGWKNNPFWGTWEGYNIDNPEDTFIVTFGYINKFNRCSFTLAGLPNGMPLQYPFYEHEKSLYEINFSHNYKIFYCDDGSSSFNRAYGLKTLGLIKDGQLKIQYEYNDVAFQHYLSTGNPDAHTFDPKKIVNKTFIGKKISNEVRTQ